MKLDSAVANLLGVDASTATVSSGSGGCSAASTSKITATTPDGQVKNYFMKSGQDATMFKGMVHLPLAKTNIPLTNTR